MLITIPDLLPPSQYKFAQELLKECEFVDGKLSAGMAAKTVKNNQELDPNSRHLQQLNQTVMMPLVKHPVYQNAVLPSKIATPFYAKYGKDMHYGDHIDDPIMGPAQGRYRSDVSITIFLNDPEEYEGGHLTIRTQYGTQQVKLPAGHAVMYPSTSLHQVAPVTEGTRIVAVTWAQSMVRSAEKREILYELNLAREKMLRENPHDDETKHVDHAYVNLIRMWADI